MNLSLFSEEELVVPVEDRIQQALNVLLNIFREGRPCCVGWSGGKDSTCVAALVLHAAVLFKQAGGSPFVVMTTGDTLVESPEVTAHVSIELRKMTLFAKQHQIRFLAKVVRPNLSSTWQVKILSGRGIPSFAGTSSDCTQDLKISPQIAFRKRLFRNLAEEGLPDAVTCLGTRFDESERRAMHMKLRGDRADAPVRNKDGDLVLSPIAMWSTDDVWEALAMYGAGTSNYPSYSNFDETRRIYAHAAGTSCAVVADAIFEGGNKRRQGGCGARLGCHVCQQAEDRSLENMINFDPRYAYAKGLFKLNKFIRNTRHDWSLRHWVGRTIKGGYIAIQPDTYHPKMIRALTRYMLQLDYDERERSGGNPKFQLLPLELMVAVDALQSLNGLAKPFQVWADYNDIVNLGIRYDIPDVDPVPAIPVPDAQFLYVGDEWSDSTWSGLRDAFMESQLEMSACAHDLVSLKNGHQVWDISTEPIFSVDTEAACMIEEFEFDRLLEMNQAKWVPGGITAGYKWYLQYGVLVLQHSNQTKHDEVCRRTAFKDQLGLTLEYDLKHLLKQTVRFADLPVHAARAWAGKATTASAQPELLLAA